jgi:hypothetical protein
MCIFCGGQCGGMGEFLISMGLPFLVLFFFKMKNSLAKIKDKIIHRGSSAGKNENEAKKCSCCGERLSECKVLSNQSIDPNTIELLELKPQEKRGPQGVKGWLLFLCLNLTIIIPFSFLYQANCALRIFYSSTMPLQTVIFKHFLIYNIINVAAMIFLSIISFYAGLSLWGVKQKAVKIAKIFLITQLSIIFIIIIARPSMIFSLEWNVNSLDDIIKSLIPFLSYFTIWYLYLSYSKRVHNTYDVLPSKLSKLEARDSLQGS